MLARLFARPANLLVLDEPTNDLDIDTLELLEQLLQEYSGTVLIVSHDRTFLDNVVTQSIVFEGDGKLTEIVGGYADWRAWKAAQTAAPKAAANKTAPNKAVPNQAAAQPAAKKLSYKDARELESLPARIAALEAEQEALTAQLNDPSFHVSASKDAKAASMRLEAIDDELLEVLTRWEELEAKQANAG